MKLQRDYINPPQNSVEFQWTLNEYSIELSGTSTELDGWNPHGVFMDTAITPPWNSMEIARNLFGTVEDSLRTFHETPQSSMQVP